MLRSLKIIVFIGLSISAQMSLAQSSSTDLQKILQDDQEKITTLENLQKSMDNVDDSQGLISGIGQMVEYGADKIQEAKVHNSLEEATAMNIDLEAFINRVESQMKQLGIGNTE